MHITLLILLYFRLFTAILNNTLGVRNLPKAEGVMLVKITVVARIKADYPTQFQVQLVVISNPVLVEGTRFGTT